MPPQKTSEWPNVELSNVKLRVTELMAALKTQPIVKGVRNPEVREAEKRVEEAIKKVQEHPLNQRFLPAPKPAPKPASAATRQLYADLKRALSDDTLTHKERMDSLEPKVAAVVRELDPNNSFLREHAMREGTSAGSVPNGQNDPVLLKGNPMAESLARLHGVSVPQPSNEIGDEEDEDCEKADQDTAMQDAN